MNELEEIKYDIIKETDDAKQKQENWNIAFGLQDVDNLRPSKYMVGLAKENFIGNISYEKVEEELNQAYIKMIDSEKIDRIVKFTSNIWQVHPFGEGNTRTTAIFIQKYLISKGFDVNNDLFKDSSKFFRNALVKANYSNISKGIEENKTDLKMFFENLLLGKQNKLKI